MSNTISLKKKHLKLFLILLVIISLVIIYPKQPLSSVSVHSADYLENKITNLKDFRIEINEGEYKYSEDLTTNVYSYNNQIPGPLIKGKVGTNKKVIVKNNLEEPTTIHWHGLQLANVADGVPQITQDPIMPGEEFEYELEFRNPGLYWYHSHVDAHKQVELGLQGAILVEDNSEIDSGNILVLDDVLLGDDYELRDFNLGFMHGRFGNLLLVNGQVNPEIQLKNNRLRIVNVANARSFNLYLEGKEFQVIGQDIGYSESYDSQILTINPGERYDVLFDADNGDSLKLTHYTRRGSLDLATLKYNGESLMPSNFDGFEIPFNISEVYNLEPTHYANLIGIGGHGGLRWTINNKAFPDNHEVFKAKEGQLVKIRIKNTQGQPHPMHLHGQKFVVVSRNNQIQENLGWKDTVMVNGGEEVDIVFRAEDKGEWVFHCHILEHAEAGMISVFKVE